MSKSMDDEEEVLRTVRDDGRGLRRNGQRCTAINQSLVS